MGQCFVFAPPANEHDLPVIRGIRLDIVIGTERDLCHLAAVRLHAEQVRCGEAPHNHLDPRAITHAERVALRDAFVVIREAQQGLLLDYPR